MWTAESYPAGDRREKPEAKYLKTLPPGTTLDGNALAFTVLPYFSDRPFTRYEMERYRKHGQYPADESVAQMIGYAPDTIVLRGTETGQPQDDQGIDLEAVG